MSRAIAMDRRNSGKRIWRGAVTAAVLTVAVASPAMADVAIGGGLWDYGKTRTSGTHAWSNYYHAAKWHSSTSTCGTEYRKGTQNPGYWSYAETWCGFYDNTGAYWSAP